MKIPKIISRYGKQYIFVKEYPNFYLYKDMYIGTHETFKKDELKNNENKGKYKNRRKDFKNVEEGVK